MAGNPGHGLAGKPQAHQSAVLFLQTHKAQGRVKQNQVHLLTLLSAVYHGRFGAIIPQPPVLSKSPPEISIPCFASRPAPPRRLLFIHSA